MQYLSKRLPARERRTEGDRRPSHGYRILAIRRQGLPDIIWLTDDRQYAIELAEQLAARLTREWLAIPVSQHETVYSVRSVRVEQWTEVKSRHRWKEIWPETEAGGRKARTRPGKQAARRPAGLPKSGDLVECVLLAEKTRRGGWKAKLAKLGLIGPITNQEEVPADALPNQGVILRVGAISDDGRHLQLVWQRPHDGPG